MTKTSNPFVISKHEKQIANQVSEKIAERIKLLKFIENGIEIYGVDKFNKEIKQLGLLKQLECEPLQEKDRASLFKESDREYIKRIIGICEKEFSTSNDKITFDDVVVKNSRRGATTELRRMLVYAAIKNTSITPTKMAKYINRTRQVVHLLLQESEILIKKPSLVKSKKFIQIYNKLKK